MFPECIDAQSSRSVQSAIALALRFQKKLTVPDDRFHNYVTVPDDGFYDVSTAAESVRYLTFSCRPEGQICHSDVIAATGQSSDWEPSWTNHRSWQRFNTKRKHHRTDWLVVVKSAFIKSVR